MHTALDAWLADAVQSVKQNAIPPVGGSAQIALASSESSEEHAREIRESALVCSNNHPTSSKRGGGDDQIVSVAGTPRSFRVCEQDSVRSGHPKVIAFHRDGRQDCFDKSLPGPPPTRIRKLDTHEKLCCSDRGDRDIVLVPDQIIEHVALSLRSNENLRV
jgi:hypothetical protein